MEKPSLTGMFPEEIAALLPPGKERYRGMQIFRWIYERNADTFANMTNLSLALREELADRFSIGKLRPIDVRTSPEGPTDKYLWECTADSARIESVIIRDEDRVTACISSQVGCRMGCAFCRTGFLGLTRNLDAGEIVDQVIGMRRRLAETGEDLTNIVFMGMGEPLDNIEHVFRAIRLITMETAVSLGRRKITVSTCGVPEGIVQLGREFKKIGLAVSLNAPDDALRTRLMPAGKAWPIADIMEAVQEFHRLTVRRVTFEYILIAGVNDSPEQAMALAALCSQVPSKVNLISFNPFPGTRFKRPADERTEAFQRVLIDRHVTAFLRRSKGSDIAAACGQLAAQAAE